MTRNPDPVCRVVAAAERLVDAIDERVWRIEKRQRDREERTIPPGRETEYERRRGAAELWRQRLDR